MNRYNCLSIRGLGLVKVAGLLWLGLRIKKKPRALSFSSPCRHGLKGGDMIVVLLLILILMC